MSQTPDTGGSAFPLFIPSAYQAQEGASYNEGMTLLDYFAAAALPHMIPNGEREEMALKQEMQNRRISGPEIIAATCYQMATAMLAEKRRREGGEK